MDVTFKTAELRLLCNDERAGKKKLGAPGQKKLRGRLDDLAAASTLAEVRNLPGRCHELKGDRAGHLALDLHGGCRLEICPAHAPRPTKPDGGLDWTRVTRVCVVYVGDYHD